MAVRTKEELLNIIKDRIGEDTSDEAIAFVEDVSDTLNDYEQKATNTDSENWKTKYEENDKKWRERYRERFFSKAEENEDDLDDNDEDVKTLTYDELFEEKEEK